MTYETIRDAAKELALNAIATEKRNESAVAASIAFESIAIHERSAVLARRKHAQNPVEHAVYVEKHMVEGWVEELQGLDAALM